MKNFFLAALLVLFLATGCVKSSNECPATDSGAVAPANEITSVQTYLNNNGLTATQHPSGFFYKINTAGSGTSVSNLCSIITVNYKGKLTNGNTFDSTATGQPSQFELSLVILGWQKGIPLVQKGGSLKLYIPPSLGYGLREIRDNAGNLLIPPGSMLIFDVDVLNIANL